MSNNDLIILVNSAEQFTNVTFILNIATFVNQPWFPERGIYIVKDYYTNISDWFYYNHLDEDIASESITYTQFIRERKLARIV
jgi:hypothetical protein